MTVPAIVSINISITDMPSEIIEMFAPDHSTSTLKILRSVNKRFYTVFSQDKFWKRNLLYSQKQYLCDIRSNSSIQNVKEVLEDIAQGNISQFHGYYRLQITHLENWLSGPTQYFYNIDLHPFRVSFMEEIFDGNEWWLFLSVEENIHIWNLTAKPYQLKPEIVGPHSKLTVIQGLKVMTFNKDDGLVSVYQFEESKLSLLNGFIFYMNSNLDSPTQQGSRCDFHSIVIGTYFLGYNHKIPSYQDSLVHVWDLNSCTKKASISLSDLDYNTEFVRFVFDYSTSEHKDITQNCKGCKINLYPGKYPDVLVCLRYPSDRLTLVLIFNVELLRVTHLIDTFTTDIISCSMNCNIVSLVAVSHVMNYEISPITEEMSFSYGEQLTFIECENRDNLNILFKNSSMLIKYDNKVDIVSLVTNKFSTKTVEVDHDFSILAFLDPNLLLMYNSKNPTKTDIKVYFVPSGKHLFKWRNVNIDRRKLKDYYWNLSYPSKLLLNFNEEHYKVLLF